MIELDTTNKLWIQLLAGEITKEEYDAALKKSLDQFFQDDTVKKPADETKGK